uniref:tRNA N(3)-methylcytidine methyltransferase n=1 Tax=Panagrellus redivivus TaxID=6233 RepID=A0A7E4V9R8_PANRE
MSSEPIPTSSDDFCPKARTDGEFGTRFLAEDNEVFSHNAWDNVDFPPEEAAVVEAKLQAQKAAAVEPDRAAELIRDPAAKWDDFYSTHENKFFMDRKWLAREAPELFEGGSEESPLRVYEVGCGVGNTTFPLLEANPNLHINCSDYSATAVSLVQANPLYEKLSPRISASVWDITKPNETVPEGSFDFVLCIYVLSAIAPEHHATAVGNLTRLLKPGGKLMVKDYGRHDLTQLRFKSGRFIADNFYCRGDDTLVYFFTPEELHDLFTAAGLRKEENFVDKRLIVNRKTQQKMYRRWMQCKYVK